MFYESYGHRYDIEPPFRLEKQQLMLGKYQPLNVRHFDNWLLIVLLSFWLLFTASDQVEYAPKNGNSILWAEQGKNVNRRKSGPRLKPKRQPSGFFVLLT